MKQNMEKKRKMFIILAVVLSILLITALTAAKYISDRNKQMEMLSQGFHISSELLSADSSTPSYDVYNVNDGIDIDLCNYEQENKANIAEMDITYRVQLSEGWAVDYVKGAEGDKLTSSDGSYILESGTSAATQTIHVVRTDLSKNSVNVTVKTTAPYEKELKATFNVTVSGDPVWTLKEDSGSNHVVLTVETNGYSGALTLKWDSAKLTPDNTNSLMADWTGVNTGTTEKLTSYSTYEFIFYKQDSTNYSDANGSGSTIQVGEN